MRNTAIYIRVSTDTQAQKGDSLGEQIDTLKKYIDDQPDLVLYDTYIDDGVSGQKLDRGDFTRLLDDVKDGKVDFIIFTKLDRWFRSLRHYLNTQAILEKHNVAWLAVSQPFYDTSTPQGRAFVAQSMMFAELEELTPGQFIQPYRGYIVNLDAIRTISSDKIIMQNGDFILIKRGDFRHLKDLFFKWSFRGRNLIV